MRFLDPDRLDDFAARYAQQYRTASPFPHVVIDDFLPAGELESVEREFPSLEEQLNWRHGDEYQKGKHGFSELNFLAEPVRILLFELNSLIAIKFLEKLTGFPQLISDPYYIGGGIHQIRSGGFLKIHHDFTEHPDLKIERKINLLIYLNSNWQESYGGHLELWDQSMNNCEVRVAPVFNRCVIFNTTKTSFHGHPDPVVCPEHMTRKSIALYYYSTRPYDKSWDDSVSVWHARPGEQLAPQWNLPPNPHELYKRYRPSLTQLAHNPLLELKKTFYPLLRIPAVEKLNRYRKKLLS